MKTNLLLMDAISNVDDDVLAKYFKIQGGLKMKKAAKTKSHWLKWGTAVAACFLVFIIAIPVIMNFTEHNTPAPATKNYENMAQVRDDLGYDTLLAKLELDESATIIVSYTSDEEGNPKFDAPLQMKLKQTYHKNPGADNVHYYVLFGKDDVNDSYIGGYEEQGLTKEINGVTVHYSEIFDGSNHTQAKFVYEGNLYVVDITTSDDKIYDLDYYLKLLLK